MLNKASHQLLQDAFGSDWGRARVEWWRFDANSKVDPDTHRWYPASVADPGRDCAVYYCVGLLKAGAKRANENVERVHVLTIDDVGTKLVPDEATATPEPTWVIETSPGNWQWQYMMPGGMDPADYVALRAAMKASGRWWAKSEAVAPANLVRLPQGVNGKPGITHNVWGQGTQKLWKPEDLLREFLGSSTANAGSGSPGQGSGPQRAPDVNSVREITRKITLGWDGSANSGLRGEWIRGLHAIKGALPDDEEAAEEIAREWSGPDEPSFDEVWQGIKPTSAGWGLLEIMAKERGAGPDMAKEAFDDDDMGLIAAADEIDARARAARAPGPAGVVELSAQQMLFARLIREEEAGRMLFNSDRGKWMEFDGTRWAARSHKMGFEKSVAMAALLPVAGKTSEAKFHSGVETFLRNHPAMLTTETAFDRDPLLAGVPSGTLSLRTGLVRRGAPGDMITKALAVDPAAREDCPRWIKFIREVTCGDLGMAWFLQQWAGYCLTGGSAEQKLVFLYGPGGNGKSVYVDTLRDMLGGYGVQASRDVFVKKTHAQHGTEIAKMAGARLVTMSEVSADAKWDEALLKDACGGGKMTARFMRQDEFTFPVTFKLLGYGNHKPVFPGGVGASIRRRFVFGEFMFKPAVPDADLTENLKAEWPGILRWALNGLLDPVKGQAVTKLNASDRMVAAADAYFAEADPLERWMLERTKRDASAWASTIDLFKDWNEWRVANNEHVFDTINPFSAALKDAKGLAAHRKNSERGFKGLRLEKQVGAQDAFDDEISPK